VRRGIINNSQLNNAFLVGSNILLTKCTTNQGGVCLANCSRRCFLPLISPIFLVHLFITTFCTWVAEDGHKSEPHTHMARFHLHVQRWGPTLRPIPIPIPIPIPALSSATHKYLCCEAMTVQNFAVIWTKMKVARNRGLLSPRRSPHQQLLPQLLHFKPLHFCPHPMGHWEKNYAKLEFTYKKAVYSFIYWNPFGIFF